MAYKRKKGAEDRDGEFLASLQELGAYQDADRDMRELMREQDAFVLDKDGQWEEHVARQMDSNRRPRYTFDQTTPAIEFIAGEIEDMDFAINVRPMSDGASRDLADLREGMIRMIENMSGATDIYRDAGRRILRRGFDAWIVKNKYTHPWSFEQDLCIEAIPNAVNRIWTDPTATQPDNSDADCTYVLHALSPEEYKEKWPDGSCVSIDDAHTYDQFSDYEAEVIVIATKYYRKPVKTKVALMTNGSVYEIDDKFMRVVDELAQRGVTVAKTKEIEDSKFCYRMMDGKGWLSEERETAFRSNPVVTVYGNYEVVGSTSKRICSGITMKMMDYNRVLNYARSREIEEGALAPKKKLMMTPKQAKGHEKKLATMNTNNDPVQFYNPDVEASPPYETQGATPNPHLTNTAQEMAMGLLVTAGVNNAMNGQYAGRMSEEALRMQIDRGMSTTRKWVNALAKGIKRTGEILSEAIPVIYDTRRQFTILNMDGTEEEVVLNEEIYDTQTQQMVVLNDLSQGRYQVYCDTGPAFSNRLEAARDALIELAKTDPTWMAMAGDIMAKSVDAPYMDIISKRRRSQMLQQGLIPFDEMTDEEKQQMQAAAQNQQPDANTLLAMAEMEKAKADQADAMTKQAEVKVKAFDAETKRLKVQVDAQKANADIVNKNTDTVSKRIENARKLTGLQ